MDQLRAHGEIGRRTGLKIPSPRACRFESGWAHHASPLPAARSVAVPRPWARNDDTSSRQALSTSAMPVGDAGDQRVVLAEGDAATSLTPAGSVAAKPARAEAIAATSLGWRA